MGVPPSIPATCVPRSGSVTHMESATQAPAYGLPSWLSYGNETLHCGAAPTQRLGLPLRYGSYPHSESTHPICRWVTPHFRSLSKFANKHSGEHIVAWNILYIYMRVSLFRLLLDVLVSCDYRMKKIKHTGEAYSTQVLSEHHFCEIRVHVLLIPG